MSSQIQREKSTVCRIFAILDGDSTGRAVAKNLLEANLLPQSDIFIIALSGKKESELEDLLNPAVYLEALSDKFGRDFREGHFRNMTKKWGDNFKQAAQTIGVAGDSAENLKTAKLIVSDVVSSVEATSLLRTDAVETASSLSRLLLGALGHPEDRRAPDERAT